MKIQAVLSTPPTGHRRGGVNARKIAALAVFLLALSVTADALAISWAVELSLKRDTIEDAMLMPSALFIDEGREQYYVVDSGKNRLLSFSRQGALLNVFIAGGALQTPFDMVRTGDGMIWVVEKGKNSLTSIDLQGKQTTPHTLRSKGGTVYPHRLETDGERLFVQDKATGDILVYDRNLNEQQRFVCSECSEGFFDFKIEGDKLWSLDRMGKSVYVLGMSGGVEKTFRLGDAVTSPVSLALGPGGFLFVLDLYSRDVAVFDPDGEFKYRFLQPGIASGQLYYPVEIRFDPWDGMCITDEGNARVEVYKQ
ncbi:MAG: NHL repeat-containing protein [Desulfobulbaceae bacterium]